MHILVTIQFRPTSSPAFVFFQVMASQCVQIREECYSDEDEDIFNGNLTENGGGPNPQGLAGWELAARGVKMAINNRVEEAQELLRVDSSCIHRQAGLCYLTFIVSKSSKISYFSFVWVIRLMGDRL